jgi:hypothetical protein
MLGDESAALKPVKGSETRPKPFCIVTIGFLKK